MLNWTAGFSICATCCTLSAAAAELQSWIAELEAVLEPRVAALLAEPIDLGPCASPGPSCGRESPHRSTDS